MVNRSVGRPHKEATSNQGSFKAVNLKKRRLQKSESKQEVQTVKRGPGRPRKDSTSTQGTSKTGNLKRSRPFNSSGSESEDDSPQIVKRRPGRPRKNATSAPEKHKGATLKRRQSDFSDSDSEKDVQVAKRGRGRPRKNAIATRETYKVHSKRRMRSNFSESDMEEQRTPMVNQNQNVLDDPNIETRDVPLIAPVPGHEEQVREPIEHSEENQVRLVVFDVIPWNAPEEIPAHGPVSIQRVTASCNDLLPFLGDLIGFEEIGFAKNHEIENAKSNLNAEGLILPFNCCHDYKKWTRSQLMEFFSQLFHPATIRKLVMKISAGSHLSMFQDEGHLEKLNESEQFINEDQFSIIQQEIEKLSRFQ
ncbi:Protein CBG17530 [Caenorhabditis briggsae]|uniref:Protein CBG17530 n=1 Tax=Caenorhabditis briggsae TaxID=6238 RepID=A8XR64_CAEBR|nr:Protein CBG17530 [Caenorhabditis briggsae]CAP35161.1 Protein CBG17530 [Caenorhabditis briggsae]